MYSGSGLFCLAHPQGLSVPVGTPLSPFCSYRASCHEDMSYLLIWPPADRPAAVPWLGCSEQSGGASGTTSPNGAGVSPEQTDTEGEPGAPGNCPAAFHDSCPSCTNVAVTARSPCVLGSVRGLCGPGGGFKAPALPPGWQVPPTTSGPGVSGPAVAGVCLLLPSVSV